MVVSYATGSRRDCCERRNIWSMTPLLLMLMLSSLAAAATPPAGRDVDITAADGTSLKATYFASRQDR
jgi:hypothetical protein